MIGPVVPVMGGDIVLFVLVTMAYTLRKRRVLGTKGKYFGEKGRKGHV